MTAKYGKLTVYENEDISPPIGDYWTARRVTAEKMRQLQERVQTTAFSPEELQTLNSKLETLLNELGTEPKMEGREAWTNAEEYGHNGVLHTETTPIIGVCNPMSPGLSIWLDKDNKEVLGKLTYNWMYEGGNHRVHGGSIAAVFDEFLATAMTFTGKTGVTAYLTTSYHKYTPVNKELRLKGRIKSIDGKKIIVTGEMYDGDVMTASAEALFIVKGEIPQRG